MGAFLKFLGGFFLFLIAVGMFSDRSHTVIESAPSATGTRVEKSRCTVTAAGYASLRNGDSYEAAIRKLGCRGEELSRSEIADYETVMYAWYGDPLGSNMNAMFQNNKLVSKSQFGF